MEIVNIIKYEGPNNIFVWKYPKENFNTATQLIVRESQEALFFKNGQALDLFTAGRYTLQTQNIPLLSRIINSPSGGETPFHSEVYFINKVDSMNILWGTRTPLTIKDPVYDIILPIGASGQFAVQIEDSRKFIIKLVGTISKFDHDNLIDYFRGIFLTKIKDYISNLMINEKISFLDINTKLEFISEAMRNQLAEEFINYGIRLVNFYVNNISIPQTDPSYKRLREAFSRKAEMRIVGYNYQQERTFDVLETAAANNSSGIVGAGIGLGLGVNMAGPIGESFIGAMKSMESSETCPHCRMVVPVGAKFCPECGEKLYKNEAMKVCPKCGKMVKEGSKFCPECGGRMP